jgi:4'-phosphopantetheinyl transferase
MELLPFQSVHVDLLTTDNADALSRREEYLPLLSADERERMARLIFEGDRTRFLLTRALVRTTLSRYASVAPADWQFITNVHGRPELLDRPYGVPDLRFNLSHTEGLIACAVTIGREVGVDVEHVGRRLTHDVAARFFAPREVADLQALPVDAQARAFFDYWTLKEAYIKARGMGLALPLGDFAFCLAPESTVEIRFEPSMQDDPATWQFEQAWPTQTHRLGLAIRRTGADLPVRMREVVPQVRP